MLLFFLNIFLCLGGSMTLELCWCSFSLQDAFPVFISSFFKGNVISPSSPVCDTYCLASSFIPRFLWRNVTGFLSCIFI